MTDMTVANTILAQLGGGRFKMMTGANTFVGSADTLRFRIARRIVAITLLPSDTYKVEVFTTKGRLTGSETDIYVDQLQAVFTKLTGLHTHL